MRRIEKCVSRGARRASWIHGRERRSVEEEADGHAIRYVLCNAQKHGLALRSSRWVDPCSSGARFDGWSRAIDASSDDTVVVAMPQTWLLRVGWKRAGTTIDPAHRPGRPPA